MLSNKKGIAMLIVIGIVLALVTLAGAAMLVSLSHFSTSSYQLKRARAFYAAEAGIQRVLWMCRTGNLPGGCTLQTGCGGTWPIQFTDTINDPTSNIIVNIRIHEPGSDPLGTGTPIPPGRYAIFATVDY